MSILEESPVLVVSNKGTRGVKGTLLAALTAAVGIAALPSPSIAQTFPTHRSRNSLPTNTSNGEILSETQRSSSIDLGATAKT